MDMNGVEREQEETWIVQLLVYLDATGKSLQILATNMRNAFSG